MELKNTAYEVEQRVATIWLDRPHRMNAWTGRLHTEYRYLLQQANDDAEVGAIVVTGRGRGFCVGGDSEALTGHSKRGSYDAGTPQDIAKPGYGINANFDAAFAYHFGLSKPVIAAVEGHAVAGGLELALWADLRVAADDAVFGVYCRRWGVPLVDGGTIRLPRLIGQSHANDMILTGRGISGDEALHMGLANRLTAPGKALQEARVLAEQLSGFPQRCLRSDRQSSYEQWGMDFNEALRNETTLGMATIQSGETREGATRFAQGAGRHGTFTDI